MIRISLQSGEVLNMRQVLTTYLDATELRDEKTIKMWLKDRILNKIPEAEFQSPVRKNEPSLILAKMQIPKALDLALKDAEMDKGAERFRYTPESSNNLCNICKQFQNENKMEFHGTVNIAENNVSSKVLILHRWVIAGDKPIIGARKEQICRAPITLSNKQLYSIKSDRQVLYTPKDPASCLFRNNKSKNHQAIGIGLAVRQNGRHKSIIDLLYGFSYSISNNQCLYLETALANAVLRNIFDDGKGLQKGQRIMFHIDNANFSEDTAGGKRVADAFFNDCWIPT